MRKVGGIDVWEYGDPDRPFRIIGIVDCGAPITGGGLYLWNLATMDGKLIAAAKEQGADGIILVADQQEAMGRSRSGTPLMSQRKVVVAIKYMKPVAGGTAEKQSTP